jgi:predicted O-methyltransferase YrrM
LIIVDNVIRKGAVLDATSQDANVQGVRRLNELLKREPRVSATALQTVGSKGHDGLLFALVVS